MTDILALQELPSDSEQYGDELPWSTISCCCRPVR